MTPARFAQTVLLLTVTTPLAAQNRLSIPPQTVASGAVGAQIEILLDTNQNLHGLSLSLGAEPNALKLREIAVGGTVVADADWSFGRSLDDGARLTWGIVLDVTEPFDVNKVIEPGQGMLVGQLTVDVEPAFEGTTTIAFEDFPENLTGDPPEPGSKNKLLTVNGVAVAHSTVDGLITVASGIGPFQRGDCNQDGDSVGTPTDAIFLLSFLFSGGAAPLCRAACDFNGDGLVEGTPTDAVYFLSFNFLGGDPLPEPVGICSRSSRPGDIAVGCATPSACQ